MVEKNAWLYQYIRFYNKYKMKKYTDMPNSKRYEL